MSKKVTFSFIFFKPIKNRTLILTKCRNALVRYSADPVDRCFSKTLTRTLTKVCEERGIPPDVFHKIWEEYRESHKYNGKFFHRDELELNDNTKRMHDALTARTLSARCERHPARSWRKGLLRNVPIFDYMYGVKKFICTCFGLAA